MHPHFPRLQHQSSPPKAVGCTATAPNVSRGKCGACARLNARVCCGSAGASSACVDARTVGGGAREGDGDLALRGQIKACGTPGDTVKIQKVSVRINVMGTH
ncbi:hypothetical protein B0H17DRAFT_1103989 [Mycena rosella]|uniref:Uncharacterized protein n=1 Tax=Mycena rosella TaxID=1033263 RepID=A0AAD7CCX8_MYCRO|nr:hypothetical protein B0H17DRAFT_1103989 [Mycena rosella]